VRRKGRHLRKLLLIFGLLLLPVSCIAQQGTVTATVTSPDGFPWANATGRANVVGAGGAQPYSGTFPIPKSIIMPGFNGFGGFSMQLYYNDLLQPPGTQWTFAITDKTGHCSFTTGPITISSTGPNPDDLSAFISSFSPPLAPCQGGGGGGGSVVSVGLAAPVGIPVTGSPVTNTGTLTWSMPTGWNIGSLLLGTNPNTVQTLPIGPNNTVLSSNGTTASWQAVGEQDCPLTTDIPGQILTVEIAAGGTNWTVGDTFTFSYGDTLGAGTVATVSGTTVTGVTITAPGSYYQAGTLSPAIVVSSSLDAVGLILQIDTVSTSGNVNSFLINADGTCGNGIFFYGTDPNNGEPSFSSEDGPKVETLSPVALTFVGAEPAVTSVLSAGGLVIGLNPFSGPSEDFASYTNSIMSLTQNNSAIEGFMDFVGMGFVDSIGQQAGGIGAENQFTGQATTFFMTSNAGGSGGFTLAPARTFSSELLALPDAEPTTNQVLSFSGVSCGINCAQLEWADNGASAPSFSAITTGTNITAAMLVGTGASLGPTGSGTVTANALSTGSYSGAYDFTGGVQVSIGSFDASTASITKSMRVTAGAVTTTNGELAYDSTAKNVHAWTGADKILPFAVTPWTNGDCAVLSVSAGQLSIADSGQMGCGAGGTTAFSTITSATNTGQTLLVGAGSSLAVTSTGTITATAVPFSGVSSGTNTTMAGLCGTGCSLAPVASGTLTANALISGTYSTALTFSSASNSFTGVGTGLTALNASNLSSGTVPAARLPNPSASTLGGIESLVATSHQWINTISTAGVPSSTQPTLADIAAGVAPTGTFDFSGVSILKARVGAGLTTSVNGDIGYDSTNKNWHGFDNAVDGIFAMFPASISVTNGHCVGWGFSGGVYTLTDAGVCGGSGGAVTSVGITQTNASSGAIFTITNTPITSSGNINLAWANASANTVFGNCTSSTATPGFVNISGSCLPNPSATTKGGVQSITCAASTWINVISTAGVPSCTQPTLANIAAGASGTGSFNFSGATTLIAPVAAGFAAATNGSFGLDSTNKNYHFFQNGADYKAPMLLASTTPVTNDCAAFNVTTSFISLIDAGACITASNTVTFTNKTINQEGTGNVITTVWEASGRAALCNSSTPGPAMDLFGSNAPTPNCLTGTNVQMGTLDYPKSGNTFAQFSVELPTAWVGNLDLTLDWLVTASGGANTVSWTIQTACTASGSTFDTVFNTAQTVTTNVAANNLRTVSTQAALTVTGCAGGNLLHVQVGRNVTDTFAGVARLVGYRLTGRRTGE
jgi:hypothetical protein